MFAARNLCLVSLSWDGVVILDVAEGPNQFKVVAQHSASFAGEIKTTFGACQDALKPSLSVTN